MNTRALGVWGLLLGFGLQIPLAMAVAEQLAAMLGATMACWALSMLFVVYGPLRRGAPWAWWCVAGSTALWFVVDSALSAHHGAWTNVLFNLSAGALIALPLLLCRPGSERDTPAP